MGNLLDHLRLVNLIRDFGNDYSDFPGFCFLDGCFAAKDKEKTDAKLLMPTYLRLPQAERERLAAQEKGKETQK